MIRVDVMYPNEEGAKFDWDYYLSSHCPMVQERTADALRGFNIDQGIAGGAPGEGPTYIAVAHLQFDSVEAFQGSFGPHVAEIMGDIPNYTPITPVIQINEIKI